MILKAYFLPVAAAFCVFAVTAAIFIHSKLKNKKVTRKSYSGNSLSSQMLDDIKKIEKILYDSQG
jgi:hypothetical protein